MKPRLFTAESIERLASDEGVTELALARGDIITPLARDRARELGLTLRLPDGEDPHLPPWSAARRAATPRHPPSEAPTPPTPAQDADSLEARVRALVRALLTQSLVSSPAEPADEARFRAKMASVASLARLTAARARSWRLLELAVRLDALAARCQRLSQAGAPSRPVGRAPRPSAGESPAPAAEAHEILHWLDYLRAQLAEARVDASPDAAAALLDLQQDVEELMSQFRSGRLGWRVP
jgi:hypothetical protein